MGWSIGYDSKWQRDVGYGVPAHCDHPGCTKVIDRGLSFVCGGEPDGGEHGCGLHFCGSHLAGLNNLCACCRQSSKPFTPKPDHHDWIAHKLTDESWQQWRDENPAEVERLRAAVGRKYGDTVTDEVTAGDPAPARVSTVLRAKEGVSHLSITSPAYCEGEIIIDRLAGDGAFENVHEGDFVWIEGRYGEIGIPNLRCEVIRSDSLSITVRMPPFKPGEVAG
jgi:hypothetical protein